MSPGTPTISSGPPPPFALLTTLPESLAVPTVWAGADTPIPALPCWVRGGLAPETARCLRVDHAGDYPLALAKAARVANVEPVRIQPAVEGAVTQVLGFKCGVDFVVAGVFSVDFLPGFYRVPMAWTVPSALDAAALDATVEVARAAGRALPRQQGAFVLECIHTGHGPRLADIARLPMPYPPPPEYAWPLGEALGIDLGRAWAEVAGGSRPRLGPCRGLAAGLRWLASRSGVVQSVEGVDAARAVPGVLAVEVAAAPGDVLGHVQDAASRARTACVRARATTRARLLSSLDEAAARVRICTTNMTA